MVKLVISILVIGMIISACTLISDGQDVFTNHHQKAENTANSINKMLDK